MNRRRSLIQSVSTGEDRSVSPVIATILMVAVTVILAAVIGATALGFTDRFTDSPPQADLQVEEEKVIIKDPEAPTGGTTEREFTAVTLTHSSGENIDKSKIKVTVNGEKAYATPRPPSDYYVVTNNNFNDPIPPWDTIKGDTIKAGSSTTIVLGTDQLIEDGYFLGEDDIIFRYCCFGPGSDVILRAEGTKEYTISDGLKLTSGDTIRMIWESGDQSVPLVEHEVS